MKYRVCVYAIAKNEEKFVDRWYKSVKEADEIYVLDTGSTDNTLGMLKKYKINVKRQIINPWRFDVARNISLDMVPTNADICVCIDLDEVLEKGWRKKLENIWDDKVTRLRYNYIWSFDEKGNPEVNFYTDKIHKRDNFKWVNPVHEILQYDGDEVIYRTDDITLKHYPDDTKSRLSYLPLLEFSVKENPNNDRNMHYLGREYMFYGMYDKCIDTLIKHLNMTNATWKDERCASMRFISRCFKNLNNYEEAKKWLELAIDEAPYLREPYVEMAFLEYENKNYDEVIKNLKIALNNKLYKNYINEPFCKNKVIYDLLSVSLFYKGKYAESLYYIDEALEYNKDDKRLLQNKKIVEQFL